MSTGPTVDDDRRLVGLDSRMLIVIVGMLTAYTIYSITQIESTLISLALHCLAGALLVLAVALAAFLPGVDLPKRIALKLSGIMVLGIALFASTWNTTILDNQFQWAYTAMLILMGILCLRGQPFVAAGLQGVSSLIYLICTVQVTGSIQAILFYLIGSIPFLVIFLYISSYIRPTVRDILALRNAQLAAVRAEAAAVAALETRNSRLDWIDRTAGPWLRRLASGTELSAEDRDDCRHLESGIRDCLRAPNLTGPELDQVIEQARRRGLEIVLIDDGALDGASAQQRSALRTSLAAHIEPLTEGRAIVRIGPPDRPEVATIRYGQGDRMKRTTYRLSDLVAPVVPHQPPYSKPRSSNP